MPYEDGLIILAAKDLFDNRLGHLDNRRPYGPRQLWANLGSALYGEDDERVKELRPQPVKLPKRFLHREVVVHTVITDKIDNIIEYLEDQ